MGLNLLRIPINVFYYWLLEEDVEVVELLIKTINAEANHRQDVSAKQFLKEIGNNQQFWKKKLVLDFSMPYLKGKKCKWFHRVGPFYGPLYSFYLFRG